MEVVILKNAGRVAAYAADLVAELLRVQPAAVLGLATGSTQLSLYRSLVKQYIAGNLSFRHTTTFNLDEYLGVALENPQSYRTFMDREFFDRIDIDKRNTNINRIKLSTSNPELSRSLFWCF